MPEATGLPLAREDWPDPVEVLEERGQSPVILVCEHASNHIPAEFDGLGLYGSHREDHIAWDIGAADVTRRLSSLLKATAFLGTFSRLLIDLNRPPGAADSIPERSEDVDVPGNRGLSKAERTRRVQRIFAPFHQRLAAHLEARRAERRETVIISIHSFTPVFLGESRPWHAGILFGASRALGRRLRLRLAADTGLLIGENEPYVVSPDEDYALLVHGDAHGTAAAMIEIRNDGLATASDRERWAGWLASAIAAEAAPGATSRDRQGNSSHDESRR